MTSNPFERQVGGTHYSEMGIQPFHFAMVNGWDAGAFSILKYLSRHRRKNGVQDLEKAEHFVDLRQADINWSVTGFTDAPNGITMQTYIRSNKIFETDHSALLHLDWWVRDRSDYQRTHLLECIALLIAEYAQKSASESLPSP